MVGILLAYLEENPVRYLGEFGAEGDECEADGHRQPQKVQRSHKPARQQGVARVDGGEGHGQMEQLEAQQRLLQLYSFIHSFGS